MNPFSGSPHRNGRCLSLPVAVVFVPMVLLGLAGLTPPRARGGSAATVCSLDALLALPVEQLAQVDIARMNLLCAEGLPGAESVDLAKHLSTLDAWTAQVKSETERHRYRFKQNPAEFEHSEGFFRMLMLAVVLTEDFGMHYNHDGRTTPAQASAHDGFFTNAADVFLTGLLGPIRQGTCSSLPVLYVAVGRRLGYPLKLVTTKGHLFVRWEDAKERFNVDATGEGVNRFDDAYYRQWPFKVTEEDAKAEGYLKSLTPAEELAAFLSIRGMCLRENGRRPEAAESFEAASRLVLGCRSYWLLLAELRDNLSGQRPPMTAPLNRYQPKD